MGRWSQYEEDDYRLPEGMQRVGYDADTGKYEYRDADGSHWHGAAGARYGTLTQDHSASRATPRMRASTMANTPSSSPQQQLATKHNGGTEALSDVTASKADTVSPEFTSFDQLQRSPTTQTSANRSDWLSSLIPQRVRSLAKRRPTAGQQAPRPSVQRLLPQQIEKGQEDGEGKPRARETGKAAHAEPSTSNKKVKSGISRRGTV